MSTPRLPKKIDPLRLAKEQAHLMGELPLQGMTRLLEVAEPPLGNVQVDIRFGVDEQGVCFLTGRLVTTLNLQCQRCLELFAYPIQVTFALSPVRNDKAAQALGNQYEPLVFDGKPLNLQTLVEDELLLSLPIVPRHALSECLIRRQRTEDRGQN